MTGNEASRSRYLSGCDLTVFLVSTTATLLVVGMGMGLAPGRGPVAVLDVDLEQSLSAAFTELARTI